MTLPTANRIIFFALICLFSACREQVEEERSLPFYGPHDIVKTPDGKSDTVLYTVPGFAFTNQDSILVSHKVYEENIYIADFFFTNCKTICPIMTSQMARLQAKLATDSLLGRVRLLSHTVDPERDSPEVLQEYGARIGANFDYWNFVTGSKNEIYDQAQKGYLVTAFESDTADGGFFHTDQFVLIDKKRRIRGYYDGTSTAEVDSLYKDIKMLINE